MLGRALRTLICFLVTLACFWAYRLVAVPWIEPSLETQARSAEEPGRESPTVAVASAAAPWADLFPADAWERKNPKLLKTDRGMLLFEDYRPVDGNQLELRPCTLVFFAEEGDSKLRGRPIVLRAPQRAVLEFEGGVNLLKARLGRLRGGRLEGEVSVYTPPAYSEPGQELQVVTRNVQVDQRRIWTPHELEFRFGPHRGKGRQLVIELGTEDQTAGNRPANLQLAAVRSVELSHVDKLSLLLPAGGLPGSFGGEPRPTPLGPTPLDPGPLDPGPLDPGPAGQDGQDQPGQDQPGQDQPGQEGAAGANEGLPTPVELTCDGPFRFDFQARTVSFEENVDVVRIHPEGPGDTLKCHRLTLHLGEFQPAKERAEHGEAAAGQAGQNQGAGQNGAGQNPAAGERTAAAAKIERVVAMGHPVQLDLPSIDGDVRGEVLEYRFATRTLHLRDSQRVTLRQQQNTVTAPELEYQLGESPRQLGRLWAAGPGQFTSRQAAPDQPPLEARWEGELRLVPEGEQHVLSLLGGARASMRDMGGFAAERIHIWLTQQAQAADGKPSIVPGKLLAEQQVRFDSNQLSGATDRLEVWFHSAQPSASATGPRPPAAERPRAETRQTGPEDPVKPPSDPASLQGGRSHLKIQGRLIRLALRQTDRWNVHQVTVAGNVHVLQTGSSDREPGPAGLEQGLVIRGESLQVDNGLEGEGQLDIVGQPATVAAQGMTIVGPSLHLRQRDNRLWMDGPGSMTLPAGKVAATSLPVSTSSVQQAPGNLAAGNLAAGKLAAGKLAAGEALPVEIRWQGGLRFNGHTARFESQVVASGRQRTGEGGWNDVRISAGSLEVELTEMLNFRHPQARKIDVKQLRFLADREGVLLTNQGLDAQGGRQSLDRLWTGRLVLEPVSGRMQADGPGWVNTVRFGRDGFLDSGSNDQPAATGQPYSSPRAPSQRAPSQRTPSQRTPSQRTPSQRAPSQSTPSQLIYLFVGFEQEMLGNLWQRELHFAHQVRVVYGPVADWEQRLDGRQLEQLPAGSVLLNCDRLAAADMGRGGPAQFELLATGNTTVEGLTHQGRFAAQAHRLSYAQAKDLLIMEGDGRRDATWQGHRAGGSGVSRAAARKIMYSRRDGRVEVDAIQYLNLGQ